MKRLGLLLLAVLALCTDTVNAQSIYPASRIFVAVNWGQQTGSQKFDEASTFPLYDELGHLTVGYDLKRTGGLLDGQIGVRIWRNFGLGIAHSRMMAGTGTSQVSASVPSPLVQNQPREANSVATISRSERAVYLHALWMIPRNRFIFTVFAGPALSRVHQDFVSRVEPGAENPPFSSVDVTSVVEQGRENSMGGSFGVDVAYPISQISLFGLQTRYGVGGFFRYVTGRANIDLGEEQISLKTGGAQAAVGVRAAF